MSSDQKNCEKCRELYERGSKPANEAVNKLQELIDWASDVEKHVEETGHDVMAAIRAVGEPKMRDCYACAGTGYIHDDKASNPQIWSSKNCTYCAGTGKQMDSHG